MRLKKVKLSGFKSFVDTTSISFPSNLTGIVGPNGCGKSNVIDAVRWVMGETSAKNLRGDSMADVIFNGSSNRKPVGVAFIELIFDNTSGTVGGQYAQYNEISIKRQVTRDGTSQYFLNSARCRRKDITDIFLGTGLGPRSYAIIEQGTISRIIEAKPEELRVFLEEAAGISKYKERRRETENRIKHTRENLDRVNDLVDEVGKRLKHLERQANTAQKYQEYKSEQRQVHAQLDALRWQDLERQIQEKDQDLLKLDQEREAQTARKYKIESDMERMRQQQSEAHDVFNEVQGEYYRLGSETARIEQAIQHAKERHIQVKEDLENLEHSLGQNQKDLDEDEVKKQDLQQQVELNQQALNNFNAQDEEAQSQLNLCEDKMHSWQLEWDEFNEAAAKPSETAQVQRTRIQQLEQTLLDSRNRVERLANEKQAFSIETLNTQIDSLENQLTDEERAVRERQETLSDVIERIREYRDDLQSLTLEYEEAQDKLRQIESKLSSLEAIQKAMLGGEQEGLVSWMHDNALADAKRLVQELHVVPGWEKALECVMGHHLEAIRVDDLQQYTSLADLDISAELFVQTSGAAYAASPHPDLVPLLEKVEVNWNLAPWLKGIYAAETIEQAMELRHHLSEHESIICKDGVWLSRHWLRVVKKQDDEENVVLREQEIKSLQEELSPLMEQVTGLKRDIDHKKELLQDREDMRDEMQMELNSANHRCAEIKSELGAKRAKLDNARARVNQINLDMEELTLQSNDVDNELKTAYDELNSALQIMEDHANQRDLLIEKRDNLRTELSFAKEQATQVRSELHEHKLKAETLNTQIESLESAISRLKDLVNQSQERVEDLRSVLERASTPADELAQQLEEALAQRVKVEEQLAEQRHLVEQLDDTLRELAGESSQVEQETESLRDRIGEQKLLWQELKVRQQTILEQLQEHEIDLTQVIEEMPQEANIEEWQNNLETLDKRISRLGAINLAAIDEFEQTKERKTYLDAQLEDLLSGLETLESAIRKIDKETKVRFQETYDKVNSGIKELFPRLFGGGQAYLELTSEDLLECGVTVMARPPGKKNSTIHLLSGGEKALTAVALVFSIFSLNPAPFCMLDEVDAPLDDANVGRFCDMVKEMSAQVQFIVITHNKITMEMAHQLSGVTMHEPGVSRIVAVDVEEAAELVTA